MTQTHYSDIAVRNLTQTIQNYNEKYTESSLSHLLCMRLHGALQLHMYSPFALNSCQIDASSTNRASYSCCIRLVHSAPRLKETRSRIQEALQLSLLTTSSVGIIF